MSSEEKPVENKRPEPPKGLGGTRRRGRRGGRGRSRGPRRAPALPTGTTPIPSSATLVEGAPGHPYDEPSQVEGHRLDTHHDAGPASEAPPYDIEEPESEAGTDLPETSERVERFESSEPAETYHATEEVHATEAVAPPVPVERPVEISHREPEPVVRPQPVFVPRPAQPPYNPPRQFRPAPASAVSQAIEEVTKVVDALRHSLEQMEEVLELVELAERQKLADEREIDALRRALRQFQNSNPRHRRDEHHEHGG